MGRQRTTAECRLGVESGYRVDYGRPMSALPPVKLSVLRKIGWREWDPIGLCGSHEGGIADEYDSYLLNVAARLQNGEADGRIVDYLVGIESEHMGLGLTPTAHSRAVATVDAIREYLRDLT